MKIKPETQELIDKGVDWWDELSRSALMQKYNISLYGGNDKLNYYVSGNFQNTDGIIKESNYERKSFNGKMNAKLLKNLSLGTNLTYAREDRRVVGEGTWGLLKQPLTIIRSHLFMIKTKVIIGLLRSKIFVVRLMIPMSIPLSGK